MTACVNKNHGRRVAGVVTASLVGALTLGGVSLAAVPTVALAEDATVQAVSPLSTATLRTYTKESGGTVLSASGNYVELTAGTNELFRPVSVTIDGTEYNVESSSDYTWTYYEANGTPVTNFNTLSKKDGDTYYVEVTKKPTSTNPDLANVSGTAKFTFKYVAKADESKYEVGYNDTYGFHAGLTYNGTAQSFIARKDGVAVNVLGVIDASGNYTSGASVKDAGSYTAVLDDADHTRVPFTVSKLDLSQGVEVPDVPSAYANGAAFEAALPVSVRDAVTVKSVTSPKGSSEFNAGAGEYTVVLQPKDGEKASNVSGEATVKFTVYQQLALFGYDGVTGTTINVDTAFGGKYDEGRFFANYDGKNYRNDSLSFTYKDSKGNKVSASDMKSGESYEVTVRLNPVKVDGSVVGGSVTFVVNLVNSELKADDTLTFKVDGQTVSGTAHVDYDGSNALDKLEATVTDADGKTYKQGTDFELVAYKGVTATGDVLTEAVNADSYLVYVKPVTFKWDNPVNAQLKLVVDPVTVSKLNDYEDQTFGKDSDGKSYSESDAVIYTGSDIDVPAVKFVKKSESKTAANGTTFTVPTSYAILPSGTYKVATITYKGTDGTATGKTVDSLKEVGYYTVSIALTDKGEGNFTLGSGASQFTVQVREAKSFADVAADKWYAKPVEDAFQQFYVNGTSGTVLFTPEAEITRADAVGILYNMAGGPKVTDDLVTEDQGYATGFSDVDSHVYYAKALAWAHKVGVANGYADGTFAPNARITRQEFAALLMNYAKATGKYSAATEDKLSGLSDASGVDAWAREAVNWAVSNKVMGNGGYVAATSNISRAEVAAMAVNYQPKALVSDVNGVKPGERVH